MAVIEIDRAALPATTVYRAFTPRHLPGKLDEVEVGASLLMVGFPLGFHDTLHHMPVVRHAVLASLPSVFASRARATFSPTRAPIAGTSGAPVVMRLSECDPAHGDLPWMLLGVHSARLDVGTRDLRLDEALGLNCAWYADILMTAYRDLTRSPVRRPRHPAADRRDPPAGALDSGRERVHAVGMSI